MSRNIKTVKGLSKHIGEPLKVLMDNGEEITATATVVKSRLGDYYICLVTKDERADEDAFWWSDNDVWKHNCAEDYQITEELKCLTSIKKKEKVADKETESKTILDLTIKELLEKLDEIIKCK